MDSENQNQNMPLHEKPSRPSFDPSAAADSSSSPLMSSSPPAQARTGSGYANSQHALFCRMMGIPPDFEHTSYPSIWNLLTKRERSHKGLYPRVRYTYQWHTFQYWFVAVVSNSFLWLQICFGAALTALGGTKGVNVSVAIVVLGALQTVFGGFLTYFKSRNQPNRARQYRESLKHVLDAIENCEELLRDPRFQPPPYTPSKDNVHGGVNGSQTWLPGATSTTLTGVEGLVYRLMDMYLDAVKEAEANYPDFWVVRRGNAWGLTPSPLLGLRPGNMVMEDGDTIPMTSVSGQMPHPEQNKAEVPVTAGAGSTTAISTPTTHVGPIGHDAV